MQKLPNLLKRFRPCKHVGITPFDKRFNNGWDEFIYNDKWIYFTCTKCKSVVIDGKGSTGKVKNVMYRFRLNVREIQDCNDFQSTMKLEIESKNNTTFVNPYKLP